MPSYDFRTLSASEFEELCRDLLRAHLNCHVESFRSGRDRGIDLRYAIAGKTTIVQCKHYAGSTFSTLLSALRGETINVSRLRPDRYIVVTSQPLSPQNKDRIFSLFPGYILSHADILGQNDLNALLVQHHDVERAHFKLWLSSSSVLRNLLNHASYVSTEYNIDRVSSKIQLYVENPSISEAQSILERYHALVISGPPGVGKTTLAEMLMFAYMASDYRPIYIFDDIDEGMRLLDRHHKQIIIFDDFLGQIQLDAASFGRRDQQIETLVHIVEKSPNTQFIMTTREYILRQAQAISDRLSSPGFQMMRYVLDVGKYTRLVRANILYNHLYF